MEKVKEVLHKVTPGHSDKSSTTTTGTGSTTHTGPHSSGLANQTDPRVDSDHDASRNLGATQTHGTGTTGLTGSSTTGTHGTHTGTTGTTGGSVPVTKPGAHGGPHSSGLANQLDPRVDSDHDASRNLGATQTHATGTTGLTGSSGTHTGTGLTGSHGTTGHTSTGHTGTTHTGPHSSGLANQADPRVDSDRDASRNLGATQTHGTTHGTHGITGTGLTGSSGTHTGTGVTGSHGTHGTTGAHTGPHSSGLANQADPGVDSDLDGSRNLGGSGTTGAGYGTTGTTHGTHGTTTGGSTTAGPHSSNLANKLDPRVDSDRDGSKTVGGNM